MDEWLEELAAELGVEPLGREEAGRLLRATRDVAHRVERKDAPLAAFLLGAAAARANDRSVSLAHALDRLQAILPPEPVDDRPRESR